MSLILNKLTITSAAAVAAGLTVRALVRRSRFFDLADKVVLVTGGSRGLGLELARQLVEEDARLAICARDEAELREAQDDLQSRHPRDLFAGVCDVTNREQVHGFVEQVRAALGPVDVLINNAGVITV